MDIEFDPAKDAINREKHGVSLELASEIDHLQVVGQDTRYNYGEDRFIAFGYADGRMYILAFTVRSDVIRPISLRKANKREVKRYET